MAHPVSAPPVSPLVACERELPCLLRHLASAQLRTSLQLQAQAREIEQLEAQQMRLYGELLRRTTEVHWLRAALDAAWAEADAVICQTGCLSHGGHWRTADQHCRRKGSRCDYREATSPAKPIPNLSDETA